MNRSILSRVLMSAVAAAALGGATVATAATDVYLSVQLPVRTAAPAYVYNVAPGYGDQWRHDDRRYDQRYDQRDDQRDDRRYDRRYDQRDDRRYDDRRYDRRAEQRACRAAAWNPSVRYRPGHQVSRNGMVYVATGLSASVWNVNSPPEWTPNYWVPANCSTRNDGHARQGRRGDWR